MFTQPWPAPRDIPEMNIEPGLQLYHPPIPHANHNHKCSTSPAKRKSSLQNKVAFTSLLSHLFNSEVRGNGPNMHTTHFKRNPQKKQKPAGERRGDWCNISIWGGEARLYQIAAGPGRNYQTIWLDNLIKIFTVFTWDGLLGGERTLSLHRA